MRTLLRVAPMPVLSTYVWYGRSPVVIPRDFTDKSCGVLGLKSLECSHVEPRPFVANLGRVFGVELVRRLLPDQIVEAIPVVHSLYKGSRQQVLVQLVMSTWY